MQKYGLLNKRGPNDGLDYSIVQTSTDHLERIHVLLQPVGVGF